MCTGFSYLWFSPRILWRVSGLLRWRETTYRMHWMLRHQSTCLSRGPKRNYQDCCEFDPSEITSQHEISNQSLYSPQMYIVFRVTHLIQYDGQPFSTWCHHQPWLFWKRTKTVEKISHIGTRESVSSLNHLNTLSSDYTPVQKSLWAPALYLQTRLHALRRLCSVSSPRYALRNRTIPWSLSASL